MARTLWSWDLATLGSERASSRLDLAPSESCLLQCQKFRSRGYICAPESGLTSLGLEVIFLRPKVSCSIIFFVLYPSPCLAPVSALVYEVAVARCGRLWNALHKREDDLKGALNNGFANLQGLRETVLQSQKRVAAADRGRKRMED